MFLADITGKLKAYFTEIVAQKYEGLILKAAGSNYNLLGSRVHWAKMKKGTRFFEKNNEVKSSVIDLDLIVMGADFGKGKKANIFSSFLVGVKEGDKIYPISKVGSGFKDEDLE